MLAFARKQELKLQSVDAVALVLGMAELLQSTMGGAIDIETRFPLSLASVHADPVQLELAVLNVKPTGKAKEITIPRDSDRQMHPIPSFGSTSNGRKFFPPTTLAITNRANQIAFQKTMTGGVEISTKNLSRGQFGKVRPSTGICGNYRKFLHSKTDE